MPSLAHELHVLVVLMDRRAETLLARADTGLTYRRYLALLTVARLDRPTQRELADAIGTSEAATSRMVTGLAAEGLLDVGHAHGNRRELALTPEGLTRLAASSAVLGDRFDDAVRVVGADPDDLLHVVTTLSTALRKD